MEIVLRALAVYAFIWILLRAMGRRELAEVSAFGLVLLVVIGDIVQQGVTQEDMSVTGAALAASTMGLLAVGASVASARLPSTRNALEGRPLVVVRDGRLIDGVLRHERITPDEVHEAARRHGYADLRQVDWGILEADGTFSFVPPAAPGPPQPN